MLAEPAEAGLEQNLPDGTKHDREKQYGKGHPETPLVGMS
jgi:hypothetical protein